MHPHCVLPPAQLALVQGYYTAPVQNFLFATRQRLSPAAVSSVHFSLLPGKSNFIHLASLCVIPSAALIPHCSVFSSTRIKPPWCEDLISDPAEMLVSLCCRVLDLCFSFSASDEIRLCCVVSEVWHPPKAECRSSVQHMVRAIGAFAGALSRDTSDRI